MLLRILSCAKRFMAGAFYAPAFLILMANPAGSNELSSSATDIRLAHAGRTAFEAGKAYRPWRQYFNSDGTTVYFGDGPSSIGKWEIRGVQYCSVWPPATRWACYDVVLTPEKAPFTGITWVGPDGSRTSALLFDGDKSALRAPPGQ